MLSLLSYLINREDGQSLAEYALILVLVSIMAMAALTALGTNASAILQTVADALQ
jgi:Flp pilus assembly pilin Flp